ncbi:MAG: hypothetical protein N3B13_06875 [Deltaproteobacteria bacterium]|nr:hypothetical protein [Deltaproteobacteria bacterium]
MKKMQLFQVIVFVLIATSLYGSVALKLSNKEMSEKADEIIIGTVKNISYIFDEKQQTPYTISTITVEKWIKGNSKEREIKIRQIGGKINNQHLFITGDAKLKEGERVLLFLSRGEEFRFILALSQAKFSVIKDEKTGEEKVLRDISQLGLGSFDKEGKMVVENPVAEQPVPLKDFIREIESYISKK